MGQFDMAENESLDLGKSPRWRRVLRAVLDDKPADEVVASVSECLRLSVNALHSPASGYGSPQVPLADLFDAIGDPREVDRLVRRCSGHDYAQLFRDSTVDAKTREAASESFLNAICEKFFGQIEMEAVKPDLERFAQQLAANPGSLLRRSRRSGRSGTAVNTETVLNESLLGN